MVRVRGGPLPDYNMVRVRGGPLPNTITWLGLEVVPYPTITDSITDSRTDSQADVEPEQTDSWWLLRRLVTEPE